MNKFEKTIIPLIDKQIKNIDLTGLAGFIDSYTYDPDKPSGEYELYLVYDSTKRNNYTIDRARRFAKSMNIKREYIKYVDGKPYLVYSFWVRPEVKKLYNGIMSLNTEQLFTVLQFWGPFDKDINSVVSSSNLTVETTHQMPLNDYIPPLLEKRGLEITKGRQL